MIQTSIKTFLINAVNDCTHQPLSNWCFQFSWDLHRPYLGRNDAREEIVRTCCDLVVESFHVIMSEHTTPTVCSSGMWTLYPALESVFCLFKLSFFCFSCVYLLCDGRRAQCCWAPNGNYKLRVCVCIFALLGVVRRTCQCDRIHTRDGPSSISVQVEVVCMCAACLLHILLYINCLWVVDFEEVFLYEYFIDVEKTVVTANDQYASMEYPTIEGWRNHSTKFQVISSDYDCSRWWTMILVAAAKWRLPSNVLMVEVDWWLMIDVRFRASHYHGRPTPHRLVYFQGQEWQSTLSQILSFSAHAIHLWSIGC